MFAAHIIETETKDKRLDLIEAKENTTEKKTIKKTNGMMIVNATLKTKRHIKVKKKKMKNIQINPIMKAIKALSQTNTPINKKKVVMRRERKRIHLKSKEIKITIHKRKLKRLHLKNQEKE